MGFHEIQLFQGATMLQTYLHRTSNIVIANPFWIWARDCEGWQTTRLRLSPIKLITEIANWIWCALTLMNVPVYPAAIVAKV